MPVFIGTDSDDTLIGSEGDDTIAGLHGDDSLRGRDGDDFLSGGQGNDTLRGGFGFNEVDGGAGVDTIYLSADGNLDTLSGGGDFNTLYFAESDQDWVVDGQTATVQGTVQALINGFNGVIAGAGNDRINLDVLYANISGGFGDDTLTCRVRGTLNGGSGDDILHATDPLATLLGGEGDDVLQGARDMSGDAGADRLLIEGSVLGFIHLEGGDGDDTLTATVMTNKSDARATLEGGSGNDHLIGASGASWTYCYGGDGSDSIEGGSWHEGGDGDDALSGARYASGGTGNDVIVDALHEDGGDGNDVLIARLNPAPRETVQLVGGLGDDTIVGSSRRDSIYGLMGADQVNGGSGQDTIHLSDGEALEIDLREQAFWNNEVIGSIASIEVVVGGDAAETIAGSSQDEQFEGGAARDHLSGRSGRDTLAGGVGADFLKGGAGADLFIFDLDTSIDRILDLSDADTIDVSAIDANAVRAGDQAFVLVDQLTQAPGQAALDFDGQQTLVLLDTDGDSLANYTIIVSGSHEGFTNFVL